MIAIVSEDGQILKTLAWESGKRLQYDPLFGFVSDAARLARAQRRRRQGFAGDARNAEVRFAFELLGSADVAPLKNCAVAKTPEGWRVDSGQRQFRIVASGEFDRACSESALTPGFAHSQAWDDERRERVAWIAWTMASAAALGLAVGLLLWIGPSLAPGPGAAVLEQTVVQLPLEPEKPVEFKDALDKMPELAKVAPETKRAIKQDLGFLNLLGRKDLVKAIGGAPSHLKDVSAGAGAGQGGSGGETLVGMGEGLQRTTVGNTGVAGLGGVGTLGTGGGAGGYGQASIGSGEGRAISSNRMAQEAALEGGLDRSVIEATIAKYMSQVRACYEDGLRRNPNLVGQVTMSFEIAGTGAMSYAKVKSSSLADAPVEGCIQSRMMSWTFPATRGAVVVRANHPFLLRPTRL